MAEQAMDLLSSLLADPTALDRVKKVLQDVGASAEEPPQQEPPPMVSPTPASSADLSFLANLLSKNPQNLELIAKCKKAYDAYHGGYDDQSIRLLKAVSPYLSAKRQNNFSQIVKALRISKAAQIFTKNG